MLAFVSYRRLTQVNQNIDSVLKYAPVRPVDFFISLFDQWPGPRMVFWSGLPDSLFSIQTPTFGTFWKAFERKILISFMTIW
jgi:hypothetical protein